MKKLLTGIVLLGFLFSFSPIASGDAPEENFYPSVKQEAGWMGYNSDNSIEYAQPSSLIGMTNFPKGDFIEKIYICDSLEATDCKRPEIKVLTFASVFTKCLNDTDTDCIDSFSIKNEDGSVISAKFQRNWVPAPVFKGDKSKFLPTGYGPSSWTLTNDEGKLETYALSVGVNGNLDLSRNPNKSNFESFFAAVQPIKEILGTEYEGPVVNVTKRGVGESRGWNTKFIEKGCQIAEKGLCGYRMPFDLEKTIVLKVRLSQPVQGWLHGRMKDADIAMKTAADNSQVVEISAKPLSVPSIYGWAN